MSSPDATPCSSLPSRLAGRRRWGVLAIGVAAQASFAAAFIGLPVAGVLMRSAYRMTTEQLGLVLGCMALGVTLSEIVWGMLTDALGDRKVLLIGLVSTGMALLALAELATPAAGWVPLGAGLVLVGALGGSVNSSSGRAVMGWFTDGKRGMAMSVRQTAIPAGGAIGAALVPWLAPRFGFQAAFSALAACCMLSALLAWRWLHERGMPTMAGRLPADNARSPLLRRDIWRLAIACGLLTAPQIAVLTFGGVFLHDGKAAGLATIATTIVAVQIGGAMARIAVGALSDRRGERRALIRGIGLLTAAATAALAVSVDASVHWTTLLVCLSGILAGAWHGAAYTEIAVMAGPARTGTALGMIGMTIFASSFITPALIPLALTAGAWRLAWSAIACAALLAAWVAPGRRLMDSSTSQEYTR